MTSSLGKDAKMALNGPVFFLIQEQAKSIVAIQALQSRMAVLEGLQERLMRAIDDVQLHLTPPTRDPASSAKSSDKKLRFSDSEAFPYPQEPCNKAKPDSLNKDSGIGNSDTSCSFGNSDSRKAVEEDDELLQLLDLIDEKGAQLFKQLEDCHLQQGDGRGSMGDGAAGGPMLDDLLFEKVDAQRQLSEVKAERDDLRQRLARLELATQAVQSEKVKVQEQLDLTLRENQSLQDRIQSTVRDSGHRSESLGFMEDIEKADIKRRYLQFSEQSRRRVSQILKETSLLELQKQLLTYVMENDVLRAKLQQSQPARLASWLKTESKLRGELKDSLQFSQSLQEALRAKDLEIASLRDRIRALEESVEAESCVRNFGMGSNEDWREPGVYTKRSNLNVGPAAFQSPLGYGDFSKTQSLPAMLLAESRARQQLQQQEQLQQQHISVYDTGSFTDVPLDHSLDDRSSASASGPSSKDLVDLSVPDEPSHHYSSASTLLLRPPRPLQPGLSVPDLAAGRSWSQRHQKIVHQAGSRLVNGHLCWKGGPPDLSSVCSEFDPLSDDACENFVDSLNLSAPMKPAAPAQLSSVGDSLHSASLDLELQDARHSRIARSADGIRDLFLDGAWRHKRPQSIGVAPVLRLGKAGRQMPVNLMHNCLHDSSDFSLL